MELIKIIRPLNLPAKLTKPQEDKRKWAEEINEYFDSFCSRDN